MRCLSKGKLVIILVRGLVLVILSSAEINGTESSIDSVDISKLCMYVPSQTASHLLERNRY